jgi:hypothetical protein
MMAIKEIKEKYGTKGPPTILNGVEVKAPKKVPINQQKLEEFEEK